MQFMAKNGILIETAKNSLKMHSNMYNNLPHVTE